MQRWLFTASRALWEQFDGETSQMVKVLERSAARLAAVQALYQMDVSGKGIDETLAEFETFWIGGEIEGETYIAAETSFFRDILLGVLAAQGPVDRQIDKTLVQTWPLARVDSVLRAILRAGTYELRKRKDVPAKVVIKEYADVAGAFFEREEVGMINAVLDALAHQLRAGEFEPRPQASTPETSTPDTSKTDTSRPDIPKAG